MNGDTPCNSIKDLLAAAEVESLESLGSWFTYAGLDCDVEVEAVDDDGIEFTLMGYGRGLGVAFPFTLNEILNDFFELELEYFIPHHITSAEESIAAFEGFEVTIELDEGISDPVIIAELGRYVTASGITVQGFHTIDYPYTTPMDGSATVADWIRERFTPHCRGCRVEIGAAPTDTLTHVRTPPPRAPSGVRIPASRG
jgi:hypothetical protein